MSTVTISPEFRVVIPKEIRESLSLKPGQEFHAIAYRGRIQLLPVRRIEEARGFLRGMDTTIDRNDDRV